MCRVCVARELTKLHEELLRWGAGGLCEATRQRSTVDQHAARPQAQGLWKGRGTEEVAVCVEGQVHLMSHACGT